MKIIRNFVYDNIFIIFRNLTPINYYGRTKIALGKWVLPYGQNSTLKSLKKLTYQVKC